MKTLKNLLIWTVVVVGVSLLIAIAAPDRPYPDNRASNFYNLPPTIPTLVVLGLVVALKGTEIYVQRKRHNLGAN